MVELKNSVSISEKVFLDPKEASALGGIGYAKVYEIVQRPDVDFENEENLITDGILDSIDVVSLVGEIDEAFDVQIHVEDLIPDNFNSVDAIIALIERIQDED